ncbi:hypothetical protein EG346_24635 [Chryseobacterium carnipullorum]|jgi:hypothetical protein|uniref:Conjugal transfer protein TraD n=2 Tax=Chryseobacterium TaxID=59732 RepID=A0A3G6MVR4_9FLAO|nr:MULTISPECIES: hypothetical protein [Chryseobacterium group]AZA51160.1 hypothetical protein EG346_24635 [Chryseobacterium carnipullorum]AZA56759.1 hypothetical protein EG350_06040 [Chryseobacterium shandongense]AZA66015.1 hypothetical protein EG345_15745 [Chryseobacterium carnipullorum]AZA88566.1 hypothetical protein EG349_18220 [Chryseobacterium shandongense]AZA97109.1 hypothetical protein EG353_16925 [Chryseobacterium shandongense]
MIKISLTILAVYVLYYAGNIVYDLFLKKEKETYKEETEEFSLSEISEQYEDLTATIGIEDVENLNTPKSFNKNLIHSDYTEGNEERQDLEYLRGLFESEQDLDEPDNAPKKDFTEIENQPDPENAESSEAYFDQKEKISTEKENQKPNEVISENPITVSADQETSRIKDWKAMLNLSETLVQMVANYDGYKVYQSIM